MTKPEAHVRKVDGHHQDFIHVHLVVAPHPKYLEDVFVKSAILGATEHIHGCQEIIECYIVFTFGGLAIYIQNKFENLIAPDTLDPIYVKLLKLKNLPRARKI